MTPGEKSWGGEGKIERRGEEKKGGKKARSPLLFVFLSGLLRPGESGEGGGCERGGKKEKGKRGPLEVVPSSDLKSEIGIKVGWCFFSPNTPQKKKNGVGFYCFVFFFFVWGGGGSLLLCWVG